MRLSLIGYSFLGGGARGEERDRRG